LKLQIIAVGHKMPSWVESPAQDYIKRMPKDFPIEVKELKPDISPAKEGLKILEALPKNAIVIAMDERGRDLTTMQLSQMMQDWRQDGKDVVFLIGGADGLSPEIKQKATNLIRLSSMTLPHAMARLLLIEQLYRAYTILQGHPYHRE
jgi:23S rRNA (pseudouridine1915-N3)-methyltransferase